MKGGRGRTLTRVSYPRPNVPLRASRTRFRQRTSRGTRLIVKLMFYGLLLCVFGWAGVVGYREAAPTVARLFELQEITVSGINQVTRQEVLGQAGVQPGQSLLWLDMRQIADRLRSHPWIKQVTVSRVLPHTLKIDVVERRPAAILRLAAGVLLLDEEGHGLTTLPESSVPSLPVLTGVSPEGILKGDSRSLKAAQAGVKLAALLSEAFEGLPEVDVRDPENAVAYVEGLRFQFGGSSVEEQWERYRKVEPQLSVSAPERQSQNEIDLRYPGKVIVRERG